MTDWPKGSEAASSEEELVQRLLEEAGSPDAVPEAELVSIKRVVRAEWRSHYGETEAGALQSAEPVTLPVGGLALAAAVILGLGLAVWWLLGTDVAEVGSFESVAGTVTVSSPQDGGLDTRSGAVGEVLDEGFEVVTGAAGAPGRAALLLASGFSVRLDRGTRIRLDSSRRIELAHGAVYVDSGAERGRGSLEIATPLGIVRDIGTQFEVRLEDGATGMLQVRVREGEVSVEQDDAQIDAKVGDEVTLRADGTIERGRINSYDPAWQWAVELAPAFDLEGRSVADALRWVERETGQRVVYASEEARRAAAGALIDGPPSGRPDQVLDMLFASAGLSAEIADGTITVRDLHNP